MARLATTGNRLRPLRFAVVGGVGVGVNTAALYLLRQWAHLALPAASVIAVELAVVNNYLLNNAWTFAAGPPTVRRFAKFNVSALGGLAVNVLAVWLLTGLGLFYLVANLIGISASFAANYALSVTWVWDGSA